MPAPEDQIVIERNQVTLNVSYGGPGGRTEFQARMPLADFVSEIRRRSVTAEPWSAGLTPPGLVVRDMYQRNGILVFLVEVAPGLRTMSWLKPDSPTPYGPSSTYEDVTVALPWQYFFVAVKRQGYLCHTNSVYFMNAQLRSLEEQLLEPHFYNCSVNANGAWCWICSQGFSVEAYAGQSLVQLVHDCISRFWYSGFNRSSEFHEGADFFGKNRKALHRAHVGSVQGWQMASAQNPDFALHVPWTPAPRTAADVYEELTAPGSAWLPANVSHLAPIITAQRNRKGGSS